MSAVTPPIGSIEATAGPLTTDAPAVHPVTHAIDHEDPWVSDLNSSFAPGECQSTVGFDDHPCEGTGHWYVEIEVFGHGAANPRWEGKLCGACLAGWVEWASQEPGEVRIASVSPINAGR